MTDPVRVFRFDELEAADPTPGMLRERAFELPILWSGRVTTQLSNHGAGHFQKNSIFQGRWRWLPVPPGGSPSESSRAHTKARRMISLTSPLYAIQ